MKENRKGKMEKNGRYVSKEKNDFEKKKTKKKRTCEKKKKRQERRRENDDRQYVRRNQK